MVFASTRAELSGKDADRWMKQGGGQYAGAEKYPSADVALSVAEKIVRLCALKGIKILCWGDEEYPVKLRTMSDPPPVVYARGDVSVLNGLSGAVVGSRKPTSYGLDFTGRISRDLVMVGIPVVSGFARGIDQMAHRAAIEGGGKTVAVLGTGIDVVYPLGSEKLLREIEESGCVLSRFPPGTPPRKHHFPVRNRIIAAISDFVCVVEAAKKSGTLITVRHALDLGKEVFAVPGHPFFPQSEGCNDLIKSGANPLTKVEDVLDALGFACRPPDGRGGKYRPTLGKRGITVLDHLDEPLSVDDLAAVLRVPVGEVTSVLLDLELKGVVRKLGDGTYIRRRNL